MEERSGPGVLWPPRGESSHPREGQSTPGSRQRELEEKCQGREPGSVQDSFWLPPDVYQGESRARWGGRLSWSFLSSQTGLSLGIQQPRAQTPRALLELCHEQLSSSAQLEKDGPSLALWLFVLDPSSSCPPLPRNIFPLRFGETPPRSAPDTSTNHTSNQMPPTGVSAPLFWVVSHPFTLCPLLGPVRRPGEASPPLQFTRVTCRKRLIVQSHLQSQLLSSLHRSRS